MFLYYNNKPINLFDAILETRLNKNANLDTHNRIHHSIIDWSVRISRRLH